MEPITLALVVEKAEQFVGSGGFTGQDAVLITASNPHHPEAERLTFVVEQSLANRLTPHQRLIITIAVA